MGYKISLAVECKVPTIIENIKQHALHIALCFLQEMRESGI